LQKLSLEAGPISKHLRDSMTCETDSKSLMAIKPISRAVRIPWHLSDHQTPLL
jgi:hypothetical protein